MLRAMIAIVLLTIGFAHPLLANSHPVNPQKLLKNYQALISADFTTDAGNDLFDSLIMRPLSTEETYHYLFRAFVNHPEMSLFATVINEFEHFEGFPQNLTWGKRQKEVFNRFNALLENKNPDIVRAALNLLGHCSEIPTRILDRIEVLAKNQPLNKSVQPDEIVAMTALDTLKKRNFERFRNSILYLIATKFKATEIASYLPLDMKIASAVDSSQEELGLVALEEAQGEIRLRKNLEVRYQIAKKLIQFFIQRQNEEMTNKDTEVAAALDALEISPLETESNTKMSYPSLKAQYEIYKRLFGENLSYEDFRRLENLYIRALARNRASDETCMRFMSRYRNVRNLDHKN